MSTANETGSIWRVLTSFLLLGRKEENQVLIRKNDLIFVLADEKGSDLLLTRLGVVDEFFIWQKYCEKLG